MSTVRASGHPTLVRAARSLGSTIAVCLAVSTAACGSQSPGTSGATIVKGSGGTVTIRSIDDLDTFNPATTGAPNLAVQAMDLTYDRLVYTDPSNKIEPYLASSWTQTDTSITFKIRSGATCADGTPVTPTIVANSLNYELSSKTNSPYLGYVIGPGALQSVTADDAAGTVTVTLTKPYNALLVVFATPFPTAIICPGGVNNPKSLDTAPNGSGPYTLDATQTVRGSVYVFKLRSGYNWGPNGWAANKDGIPDTVKIQVATDETTGANLITTGQVDIAPVFGINEPRVEANKSAYTFTTNSLQMGSWGVVFNQTSGGPGGDPAVRHAAYLALDTKSMITAAFSNEGVVFNTMVTPNMRCYNPAIGSGVPGFDPAQAKSILQSDGYTLGSDGIFTKNGKPLKFKIVMWNTTNQLGDYMQTALKQAGMDSTVNITDINTWIAALFTTKDYDLSVYSYYSSVPDPVIIPAQDASLSINDPTYVSLSNAAEEAPAATACAAWDTALKQAITDYDVKPIGVSKNIWFGRHWQFAAPVDVIVDPFTLEKTT